MIPLLIISDDFTGALDTGVHFAKNNIPTMVTTKTDIAEYLVDSGLQVVVVDVECRHESPNRAAEKTAYVLRQATGMVRHVYLKTDSALRGNIGAVLAAALPFFPGESLVFIPAYPHYDRITRQGVHYISGEPLERSIFADDPLNPTRRSHIADIIAEQTDTPVVRIESGDGPPPEPGTICLYDCETDEQLRDITDRLAEAGRLRLMAGCAGFASHIKEVLPFQPGAVEIDGSNGNTLIVCGSMNKISFNQASYAEMKGYAAVVLTPEEVLDPAFPDSEAGRQMVARIAHYAEKNRRLLLKTLSAPEDTKRYQRYAQEQGIDSLELYHRVAQGLGEIVARVLATKKVGYLVLFGGDTVMGVMSALGCERIYVKDEIEPGVPISTLAWKNTAFNIITKSGGLGSRDVILKICRYIDDNAIHPAQQ